MWRFGRVEGEKGPRMTVIDAGKDRLEYGMYLVAFSRCGM